ncbi:hypothetical protein GGR60_000853 [Xanthomonas arboricola]|uniref:hypothetical protein n=2 Tax=Xanthomonas TaxID=338 RepID=UPI00169E3033|nr:hypothetical protein [Xanthomonas euroxanthea]NJC36363.1 hypothetical protein [Xanthomonas euroxanthea]
MDTTTPSLFEQLQQRLAATSEPLEVLNQFEAELLFAFPGEAAVIVELVTSWGHRLGVLTHDELEGYVWGAGWALLRRPRVERPAVPGPAAAYWQRCRISDIGVAPTAASDFSDRARRAGIAQMNVFLRVRAKHLGVAPR